MMPGYKVTKNNIRILDSYKISKDEFDSILYYIKDNNPDCDAWKRSFKSLMSEWACHNAAYNLGIRRNKTKDVDLNYPQKWYVSMTYYIIGALVWLFIK